MKFSPFFFSSHAAGYEPRKYELLLESVKFADEHGFHAVWVPERHFHAFGGVYPNPAVIASALAMITKRVRLRAGSLVLPLHNPVRAAEDWAVVDNLSDGRVDISFARGWNPQDFALAPEAFERRTAVLYDGIERFLHLWRGGSLTLRDGVGAMTETRIFPLPRQGEPGLWMTCTGGEDRFVEAGEKGFNVLTSLIFQRPGELARKIERYREARRTSGRAVRGEVTVMLHTYLDDTEESARRVVAAPFREYLASSVELWSGSDKRREEMSEREREEVLDFAFERYYRTAALFGTPASCLPMIRRLADLGVDEIACLIDFGVSTDAVLAGLRHLVRLVELLGVAADANEHPESLTRARRTELLRALLAEHAYDTPPVRRP
jgi:natural product biosynthesis luciferase-like monooxygenase protein